MRSMPRKLPPLDGEQFDVAIIGGGINGAAIARECAHGGRRTVLLEKDDFGSGTTSRSTRIIHGGLRYLEHGEIATVRECLKEREKLLRERPHLVRPKEFILAMPKGRWGRRSALAIRFGLWLYRHAAAPYTHRSPCRSPLDRFEQMLDAGLDLNVFHYEDAQCEYPERLVAEWVSEATTAGAWTRNHTEVLKIEVHEGRARYVIARDSEGHEARIQADWIINATGPWADRLCEHSGIAGKRLIGGVRGSHLVLRNFPGAPTKAIYAEAVDGRPVFVVPWGDQLLVGTTESRAEGDPSDATPSKEEGEYLWNSLRRLLLRSQFSWNDVNYAFAGVRALPYEPSEDPGSVSRRHIIHDHLEEGIAGLISIVSGKLTTAAALGRECARKIGIKRRSDSQPIIAVGPASGIDSTFDHWASMAAKATGLPVASTLAIAEWHGRNAMCITRLAASDQELRATLCPHTPHVVAEAVQAVYHELAETLGDILLRRVPVALGSCWNRECSEEAARKIAAVLGWTPKEVSEQLDRFELERTKFLVKPKKTSSSLALYPQGVT